jgi:alkanesulfonate monooxygenase SsuD/methylene tetrahydromethanopterin reductase-like flavin-dependent oxidoreductase (luciferase family)
MVGTLDAISGGRFVAGVGAGWKQDEYVAYGYGFPPLGERMEILRDTLEILEAMLSANVATYQGRHLSVRNAHNVPRGLQEPHVPIMVGGNGPNVTWRLAARFADELNLDGMLPDRTRDALPVIRARCEEIGRDPASLKVSVHAPWEPWESQRRGAERAGSLAAYAELGVARIQAFLPYAVADDEALDAFAEDVRAAGLSLG